MRILVDTDPALMVPGLDLDDDLALLALLGSPEVELAGVTTTYGNTLGWLAQRDARRLLAMAGRDDIPVVAGAGWFARDLRETAASRFLVDAVRRAPGELTLVTLGPLTNLAAAAHSWPELPRQLAGLVLLGGRAKAGLTDFNFHAHPEAARRVLDWPCRKTLLPIDLCFPAVVTRADVARLTSDERSVVARFRSTLRRFAWWQHLLRGLQGRGDDQEAGGFHPWDLLAPAWLLAPELFSGVRELYPTVEATGLSVWRRTGPVTVTVPARVDAAGLVAFLLARAAVPRLLLRR